LEFAFGLRNPNSEFERDIESEKDWIAALDKIESFNPVAVIAGHKRPGAPDTPHNIEETRKYIRDFDRTATNTPILRPRRSCTTRCSRFILSA
jgi:hypothetical protein